MKKSAIFFIGFVSGASTIIITVIAAILCFCCPVANPGFVNALLFRPMKDFDEKGGQEIAGVKGTDVLIPTKEGGELFGRIYNQNSKQIVLYNHGQGGNVSLPFFHYKIGILLSTGASVLAYDYRGYGKSRGSPTPVGVVADARSAYDYVINKLGYKPQQVIIYGESLGSGISADLASQVECGGVVLESGFASIEKIGKDKFDLYQIYPASMFPQELNSIKLVEQPHHPPILIMHGKKDGMIPCHHSQYLFDHATKPAELALFDDCTHGFFGAQQTKFNERLKKFVTDCAGGTYAVQTVTARAK